MRSSCLFYLVVVSIVLQFHPILCPVVREWCTGAGCMWEKSERLSLKLYKNLGIELERRCESLMSRSRRVVR